MAVVVLCSASNIPLPDTSRTRVNTHTTVRAESTLNPDVYGTYFIHLFSDKKKINVFFSVSLWRPGINKI